MDWRMGTGFGRSPLAPARPRDLAVGVVRWPSQTVSSALRPRADQGGARCGDIRPLSYPDPIADLSVALYF
jgi:hypothetical protein